MNRAYGFVEIIGMASAVVAVDTALKAANVTLEGLEPAKGQGMHTLKLAGNVGAVNAAVSSILGSPELANKVWSHTVIARPSKGLGVMIHGKDDVMEKETLEVEGIYENSNDKDAKMTKDKDEKTKEGASSKDEAAHDDDVEEKTNESKDGESSGQDKESLELDNSLEEPEESPEKPIEEKEEILEKPSLLEPIKEAAHKSRSSENEEDLLEDKNYTCNLCKDQTCPRIKGEPRVKCIHYNEKE